jgi:hypothetical protein
VNCQVSKPYNDKIYNVHAKQKDRDVASNVQFPEENAITAAT